MKVTVEVDCTASEARQFLGLPNVEPMQQAVMAEVERRMLAEMDRFSTEAVLRNWLSLFPQSPEQMQGLFSKLFQHGFGMGQPPRTEQE